MSRYCNRNGKSSSADDLFDLDSLESDNGSHGGNHGNEDLADGEDDADDDAADDDDNDDLGFLNYGIFHPHSNLKNGVGTGNYNDNDIFIEIMVPSAAHAPSQLAATIILLAREVLGAAKVRDAQHPSEPPAAVEGVESRAEVA